MYFKNVSYVKDKFQILEEGIVNDFDFDPRMIAESMK